MKVISRLMLIFTVGFCLPVPASTLGEAAVQNEARQVGFAERVITIELSRALSASIRVLKEKCSSACADTGALELGVGLIGVSQSGSGSAALVNLLGVRLDGAGSEELTCQILTRGDKLSERLESMDSRAVTNHCRTLYVDLQKRELRDVSDVGVDQVCRTDSEVDSARDEFLKATKSNVPCEQ